jgi:hypothetical protein
MQLCAQASESRRWRKAFVCGYRTCGSARFPACEITDTAEIGNSVVSTKRKWMKRTNVATFHIAEPKTCDLRSGITGWLSDLEVILED